MEQYWIWNFSKAARWEKPSLARTREIVGALNACTLAEKRDSSEERIDAWRATIHFYDSGRERQALEPAALLRELAVKNAFRNAILNAILIDFENAFKQHI